MFQVIRTDRGQLKCWNVYLDQDQKAVYLARSNSCSLENHRIRFNSLCCYWSSLRKNVKDLPSWKYIVDILIYLDGISSIWFWFSPGMCLIYIFFRWFTLFFTTDIVQLWKLHKIYLHVWVAWNVRCIFKVVLWMYFTLQWVPNILHCASYTKYCTGFSKELHFMLIINWNHIFLWQKLY